MAAERALTIAITIHSNCQALGHPPAASMAPQSAKGSAKIECSHLIISRETRKLWSFDIGVHCNCCQYEESGDQRSAFGVLPVFCLGLTPKNLWPKAESRKPTADSPQPTLLLRPMTRSPDHPILVYHPGTPSRLLIASHAE